MPARVRRIETEQPISEYEAEIVVQGHVRAEALDLIHVSNRKRVVVAVDEQDRPLVEGLQDGGRVVPSPRVVSSDVAIPMRKKHNSRECCERADSNRRCAAAYSRRQGIQGQDEPDGQNAVRNERVAANHRLHQRLIVEAEHGAENERASKPAHK